VPAPDRRSRQARNRSQPRVKWLFAAHEDKGNHPMTQGKGRFSRGAFASLRYRKTRDRIIELILMIAGLVACSPPSR